MKTREKVSELVSELEASTVTCTEVIFLFGSENFSPVGDYHNILFSYLTDGPTYTTHLECGRTKKTLSNI